MELTKQQIQKFNKIRELSQMQSMAPIEFEKFIGWLYQERGYHVSMTATRGDEGIDLRLSLSGKKMIAQCKRYSGTVGQPTVRDLYGSMFHAGAESAYLVTTGKFSRQAETWAAGKPILLIDGNDLVAWINKKRRTPQATEGTKVDSSPISEQLFTDNWLLIGFAVLFIVIIIALLAFW